MEFDLTKGPKGFQAANIMSRVTFLGDGNRFARCAISTSEARLAANH